MTDTTLRWTPSELDGGRLVTHQHADGDAYTREHTHRLTFSGQAHVHSTRGDEAIDAIQAAGYLPEERVEVTRSQDGTVRMRVHAPEWILGVLVDVLAQAASGALDLSSMPDDPQAAAAWIRENAEPILNTAITVKQPVTFARDLAAIIPGATQ